MNKVIDRIRFLATQRDAFAFVVNALLFLVGLVVALPLAAGFGLAAGIEKLRQGHASRVLRAVAWVLNLRLPGLLLALAVPLGAVTLVVATVEKLRYGELNRTQRILAVLALIAMIIAVPFVFEDADESNYRPFLIAQAAIFTLVCLSTNVVTGYIGELSIGQGGFVLLGAYVPAMILNGKLGESSMHPLVAVLIGSAITGVIGMLIALPSIRLSGVYLSLVTLAFAVSVPLVLKSKYALPYTDGPVGLSLDPIKIPEMLEGRLTPEQFVYFAVVIPAMIVFVAVWNILRGPTGRSFTAVRDSEVAARMIGLNVERTKLLAFALSATCAGFAGGLYVILLAFVSADSFTVLESIAFLVAAVVGGLGRVVGSVMGGFFLAFQPDLSSLLQSLLPDGANLRWAIYGSLVIFVTLFWPRGIGGALYKKQ